MSSEYEYVEAQFILYAVCDPHCACVCSMLYTTVCFCILLVFQFCGMRVCVFTGVTEFEIIPPLRLSYSLLNELQAPLYIQSNDYRSHNNTENIWLI